MLINPSLPLELDHSPTIPSQHSHPPNSASIPIVVDPPSPRGFSGSASENLTPAPSWSIAQPTWAHCVAFPPANLHSTSGSHQPQLFFHSYPLCRDRIGSGRPAYHRTQNLSSVPGPRPQPVLDTFCSCLESRPSRLSLPILVPCLFAPGQASTTAVYRCFDRRNSTLKRLSRSHPGTVLWAVTHILAVDAPTTSVSCTTALLAYCTRSCLLRWQEKTPCITLLPASSAVTHDSAGPAFSYVFHPIFFSKLFPRMIAMMFSPHHHHHRPEKSS